MSLLEDIFLHDEENEAQELERIIEGDEYEGRPRSDSDDNSEKEDEAVEEKRKVDPTSNKTRRVIKNPRFTLNPARLTGPRGIQVVPDHFKDFKFKGKGHEKEDLDLVLKRLEHWAYRLYPKFKFEDCLKKIETLGKKRPVMVHLHKIRTDQYLTEETVVQEDSSDEEAPQDEFDKLLQQQIELARNTPAPNSARKGFDSVLENRSLTMPKATSSPSISEEQRERMLRNRKIAEERLARRNNTSDINTIQEQVTNGVTNDNSEIVNNNSIKRHNKSNVIESSDEEEVTAVNESISVDIHMSEKHLNTENDQNSNNDKSVSEEISTENTSHFDTIDIDVDFQDSSKSVTNNDKGKVLNSCDVDKILTDKSVTNNDGSVLNNCDDFDKIVNDNSNGNIKTIDKEKPHENDNFDTNDVGGNIDRLLVKDNQEINQPNTDTETTEQENIESTKGKFNSNDKADQSQNDNICDTIDHEPNDVTDKQNNSEVIENELPSNTSKAKEQIENIDDLMDVDFDDDF